VEKIFIIIHQQTSIRTCKNENKDNWKKTGLYLSRCKEKWDSLVKKHENERDRK
jgi:hypothetical protein